MGNNDTGFSAVVKDVREDSGHRLLRRKVRRINFDCVFSQSAQQFIVRPELLQPCRIRQLERFGSAGRDEAPGILLRRAIEENRDQVRASGGSQIEIPREHRTIMLVIGKSIGKDEAFSRICAHGVVEKRTANLLTQ
ncbi:hypothetical protein GGE45_006258 [Rhizobium aethiopicum]|nr:hypothetical protein [Rhizobium aethiopicum]